jgi:hypothetical protein
MSAEQKKGDETVNVEVVKTWYAFCRIPNGLKIKWVVNDEKKHIILKSGYTQKLAGDGETLTFAKEKDYGITKLTEEQMQICKKEVEKSGIYIKGYVFFAETEEQGRKMANKYLEMYKTTGFERLTINEIKKLVETFKKD